MSLENLFSVADSKNVALVLSLIGNVVMGFVIRKLYLSKEELHEHMTGFLSQILPFAIATKLKNDQKD